MVLNQFDLHLQTKYTKASDGITVTSGNTRIYHILYYTAVDGALVKAELRLKSEQKCRSTVECH